MASSRSVTIGHDRHREHETRGHGRGHRNLQAIHAGLKRDLPLLDEPVGVAGDHGQGRLSPPDDLCLGRFAGLELRAIDQQQQPLRIVVAGDGQFQPAGNGIAEAIGSRRTDEVLAAFGQLERLSGRAIGCRGKRMLLNQFLAGGFADLVLPEDLQRAVFPSLADRRRRASSRGHRTSRPPRIPAGSFPGRSRSRAWRPSGSRRKDSDRDGMAASNVMRP